MKAGMHVMGGFTIRRGSVVTFLQDLRGGFCNVRHDDIVPAILVSKNKNKKIN